jgi:ribosomal subunit interface protein
MDMAFTGRGVQVTDEIREMAAKKLSALERMEPRVTGVDLEVINENHPKPDGLKRVEAALHIPRKTFRAHGEAPSVPAAIDIVKEKLERQLRDHHGKKRRGPHKRGLESPATPTSGQEPEERAEEQV